MRRPSQLRSGRAPKTSIDLDETDPLPIEDVVRTKHRDECRGGPRPCPLVGCVYNNYLTVLSGGTIRINRRDLQPEDVSKKTSCALDVADAGEHTLDYVGTVLGLTRERVRQIEVIALVKVGEELAKLDKRPKDILR
jgi:hypothetical protein